jgi:hypothetical protein
MPDQTAPDPGALFRCEHPARELRRRITAAGAEVFAEQCTSCGHALVRRKAEVPTQLRAAAPPFDQELSPRWWSERTAISRERWEQQKAQEKAEFWTWYEAYLLTPEWRARRALVMRRAGGVCEGCLSAPASQVHHTTYAHVGDELLYELRAVCDGCHERAHRQRDE